MTATPLAGRHIGLLTAAASRANGGVWEAVVAQAALVRMLGGRATVFAPDDPHGATDADRLHPSRSVRPPVSGPAGLGHAPGLGRVLNEAGLDLLHLHGIWRPTSLTGARWAGRTGRPYVVSPHGMLDPWITGRSRAKKAVARLAFERRGWRAASRLHALTDDEALDIERETGRADSAVVPNPGPPPTPFDPAERSPAALSIGRIHAKKNWRGLLAGWALAKPRLPVAARLTVAGWGDEAEVTALRRAIAEAGDPSIGFIGPAHGADKAALFAGARAVVLPSFSEGLPVAVLEGWAAGVPTVMTDACHLPAGFEARAAVRCTVEPAAIADGLVTVMGEPHERWVARSAAAHRLASGPFSPATVASEWGRLYGELLGAEGGAP